MIWQCFGFRLNNNLDGKSRILPNIDATVSIDVEEEVK
jgi:hypothetical protein